MAALAPRFTARAFLCGPRVPRRLPDRIVMRIVRREEDWEAKEVEVGVASQPPTRKIYHSRSPLTFGRSCHR